MISCSFRKAMLEPQKLIEPMIAASRIGIRLRSSRSPPEERNSTMLMSATAPPPRASRSRTRR
jgi:hypothetical protein